MIRLKSLLTEDEEPDVTVRGNTSRLIDLTSSRKGLAIYKKLDIDRVKYYQGGRVLDPETGETIVTAQRNLSDEQVIDFLYKNRNSQGGYRGFQNNIKKEQAQFGGMQSPFKKTSTAGTTTITGLQLKQATIKREGMYVEVSFGRNDMKESDYSDLDLDGTCTILLFMKGGEINYTSAYCVDEEGSDYAEMQKFVEFRLDLPAPADTNNFSQDILTAFGK